MSKPTKEKLKDALRILEILANRTPRCFDNREAIGLSDNEAGPILKKEVAAIRALIIEKYRESGIVVQPASGTGEKGHNPNGKPSVSPVNPKVSKEQMLDTLEHCRLTMTHHEVQALAGKWNEHDEEVIGAIRVLILAAEKRKDITIRHPNKSEWAEAIEQSFPASFEMSKDIRDFGEEK